MKSKKNTSNYWFTVEPYVYVGITNNCALLYNTLDGVTIESNSIEVISLLSEILKKENCGVVLLTKEIYIQTDIYNFISELREKYMGDIIDITLSNGKPVQVFPFFNFSDKRELYEKINFFSYKNILENLYEICVYVDGTINVTKLISVLKSVPSGITFNVIGNIETITNYTKLLSFFDQVPSPKNIACPYTNVIPLQPNFENNFSYKISVHFPIDMQQWSYSRQLLLNQTLPFEYIFEVSSVEDCQKVEQLVEQFHVEKYQLKPIYTGYNIVFFEENVFLTKEDILSGSNSNKDFFARQMINTYDFGKINIMPNGDVYANLNHPLLGNVYTDSIYEIVQKEIDDGKSWFRIRNQVPCNNCVYQWLCPSPSNYEITIGRPNLCHVKQ